MNPEFSFWNGYLFCNSQTKPPEVQFLLVLAVFFSLYCKSSDQVQIELSVFYS